MATGANSTEEERKGVVRNRVVCVCRERDSERGREWRVEVGFREKTVFAKTRRRRREELRQSCVVVVGFFLIYFCVLCRPTCVSVWWCCSSVSPKQSWQEFGFNSKQVSCVCLPSAITALIFASAPAGSWLVFKVAHMLTLTGVASLSCSFSTFCSICLLYALKPVPLNSACICSWVKGIVNILAY